MRSTEASPVIIVTILTKALKITLTIIKQAFSKPRCKEILFTVLRVIPALI